MNEHPPQPEFQAPSPAPRVRRLNSQKIIIVLSACIALQMTSYVMIFPLFPLRFSEFGAGVKALGISSMALALASTLAAPFLGALADRFGRKPLILGSLAAYMAAFFGYLFAPTASILIILRGLTGAFTAGLMPAVTGLAADLAPGNRKAQWISIVSGGAAFGWVAGPIAGGMVYDRWGYSIALVVSIITITIAFFVALLGVPKHQPAQAFSSTNRNKLDSKNKAIKVSLSYIRSTLPDSLSAFAVLLFICFAVLFAWAFIEPKFMFYAYNELGWNSSMLGLMISTYGVAMTFGEFAFGNLSDRLGRKRIIITGLVFFSAQFIGLAFFRNYLLIAASFVIAGLGNALYDPALSASILDISPVEHRARILGIRYTAASLGSIIGPALVVLVTSFLSATGIFLVAVGIVLLAIVAGLMIRIGIQPSKNTFNSKVLGKEPSLSQTIDEGEL